MKAFVSAVVVAVVMSIGAYSMLGSMQRPVQGAFSTSGVRL